VSADRSNVAQARVYHDLRTSIGGILSTSWLLEKEMAGPVTADQRRFLENIAEAARQLSAIVDRLDPEGARTERS
jgi:signal transduction histidine kinase